MVRQLGIAQVMTEKNPELHAGDTVFLKLITRQLTLTHKMESKIKPRKIIKP